MCGDRAAPVDPDSFTTTTHKLQVEELEFFIFLSHTERKTEREREREGEREIMSMEARNDPHHTHVL